MMTRLSGENEVRSVGRERRAMKLRSETVTEGGSEAGALWTVIEEKEESLPGYPELLDCVCVCVMQGRR